MYKTPVQSFVFAIDARYDCSKRKSGSGGRFACRGKGRMASKGIVDLREREDVLESGDGEWCRSTVTGFF